MSATPNKNCPYLQKGISISLTKQPSHKEGIAVTLRFPSAAMRRTENTNTRKPLSLEKKLRGLSHIISKRFV